MTDKRLEPMAKRTGQRDATARTCATPHKASQKGAAVVEAGLIFLPFIALIFAILDFSFAIFVENTLYHAAREGVRFAVTQQTSGSGQDAAIKDVVKQNSMGFLDASAIAAYVTLNYYDRSGNPVSGVGSNQGGNILVLKITGYPWTFFAPIWRPPSLAFSAFSSDAMESPPLNILPAR